MSWEIQQGDALERLREMPDQSVQCCVTSPPYWGLRDYGVDGQLGSEATPEQFIEAMVGVFAEVRRVLRADGTLWLNIGDSYNSGTSAKRSASGKVDVGYWQQGGRMGDQRVHAPDLKVKDLIGIPWMLAFALRADGWYLRRDIIWSKPNPMPESVTDRPTSAHEYLFLLAKGKQKTRVIRFADLHCERVHLGQYIRPDAADSWAHNLSVRLATAILDSAQSQQQFSLPALDSEEWKEGAGGRYGVLVADLPVKHRAPVLAARLLRSDTSTKEFLCELDRLGVTLADRDQLLVGGGAAVFTLPPGIDRYGKAAVAVKDAGEICQVDFASHSLKRSRPSGCSYFYDAEAIREAPQDKQRGQGRRHDGFNDRWDAMSKDEQQALGRNKRSVWTIATKPYADAHFATFPAALVEPCILAGTPEKSCSDCGAPWRRLTDVEYVKSPKHGAGSVVGRKEASGQNNFDGAGMPRLNKVTTTTGFEPICDCGAETIQPVVLDPFAGASTTGLVALRHNRSFVGIELNPEYVELGRNRILDDAPLLNAPAELVPEISGGGSTEGEAVV
jgi:DNA modification methylase